MKAYKKHAMPALNMSLRMLTLGPLERVFSAVDALVAIDKKVIVRWHPGQSANDVNNIKSKYSAESLVTLSCPKRSKVGQFLEQCNIVIAGNSSILLEAILSGAKPVYYQFDPRRNFDYYGYCERGLALQADGLEELVDLVGQPASINSKQSEAARYFSATYATE